MAGLGARAAVRRLRLRGAVPVGRLPARVTTTFPLDSILPSRYNALMTNINASESTPTTDLRELAQAIAVGLGWNLLKFDLTYQNGAAWLCALVAPDDQDPLAWARSQMLPVLMLRFNPYRHEGRVEVGGWSPHSERHGVVQVTGVGKDILVSMDRGAAVIARAIKTRYLHKYLSAFADAANILREYAQRHEAATDAASDVLALLGTGTMVRSYSGDSAGTIFLNGSDAKAWGHVSVKGGGRLEIELSVDAADATWLLREIGKLVKGKE